MYRQAVPLLLTLCFLIACDKTTQAPSASLTEKGSAPNVVAADKLAWLGRWTGPEGTYLEVLIDGQKYKVAIRNLDGVRTFEAAITEYGLSFERDGITENIAQGSGKDTGMKWLLDKSNCLFIKAGEGYCRD